jgi:putative aminopeptidase FrvX
LNAKELLSELVAAPGPPGQEERVRAVMARHAAALGCAHREDARGNLLISSPGMKEIPSQADIVVTAHLDEIALLVQQVETDGRLQVVPLGGLLPWKCGEGPVTIMPASGDLNGVLGFGSVHTNLIDRNGPGWGAARVFTGLSKDALTELGVRPGTRLALGMPRRSLIEFGDFIAGPFLDDRADLVAMLLALEMLGQDSQWMTSPQRNRIVFAATAAEEVMAHGAMYVFSVLRPSVAIALEIGPRVPESQFELDSSPTVWANDGFSAMQAKDMELVAQAAKSINMPIHWQCLSLGGSDASIAASHGLVARPFTIAFAAENSHGFEIMHRDAMVNLARLLAGLLKTMTVSSDP